MQAGSESASGFGSTGLMQRLLGKDRAALRTACVGILLTGALHRLVEVSKALVMTRKGGKSKKTMAKGSHGQAHKLCLLMQSGRVSTL